MSGTPYCNCCQKGECRCNNDCPCHQRHNSRQCNCHDGNFVGPLLTPEIVDDLSKKLAEKSGPGGVHAASDPDQLETHLLEFTKGLFKDSNGYPWNGDGTVPPSMPSSGSVLRSIKDFVHVEIGNTDRATSTFSRILAERQLPEWAMSRIVADIGAKAISMFNDATSHQWKETTFQGSYEGPNREGPLEVRTSIVYINAELTENNKTGTHMVLHYVAVYHGPEGVVV